MRAAAVAIMSSRADRNDLINRVRFSKGFPIQRSVAFFLENRYHWFIGWSRGMVARETRSTRLFPYG